MASRIGSAFVSIEADTSLFRTQATAGVTKALAGIEGKVPISADTKEAVTQIEALKRRMIDLNKQLAEVKIGADGKPAEATIRKIQLDLKKVADTVANIAIGGDTTRLDAAIAKEEAGLEVLRAKGSSLSLDAADAKLTAKIASSSANLSILKAKASDLTLDANEAKLNTKIFAAEAGLAKLNEEASNLRIDADDKILKSKIADMVQQAFHLRAALGDPDAVRADVDTAAMRAKVSSLDAQALLLGDHLRKMTMDASDTLLLAKIDEAKAELKLLREEGDIPLIATATAFDAAIAAAEAELRLLRTQGRIPLVANKTAIDAAILDTTAKLVAMRAAAKDLRIGGPSDLANLAKAEGALLGLEEAAKRLNPELKDTNNALNNGFRGFGRFGLGVLTARVALFGGLTAISGFHIALDVVIESLAVLIPALVTAAAGLAAFGLAGVDAGKAVAFRLQNVHTVADAFNAVIPPMTNNLEKLHAVVRPQVWQLYGDAISAAGTHSQRFNDLAIATGGVVDRLAAKLTILVKSSGTGIDKFFASGARDLQQFARILSNLGDAFGKLIQISERTGIAEALLSILNAGSKLLDLFTKLPIPLLTAVIAFHGIYIWSGLAASGLTRLLRPLAAIAGTAAGTKAAGTAVEELAAAGSSTRFQKFGATTRDLGTNLKAAGSRALGAVRALGGFIATPWGAAIALGVIALGGLVFVLSRVRDSTGEAIKAIDTMVNKATVFTVINKLGEGLAKSSDDIAAAQRRSASASIAAGAAIQGAGQKYSDGKSAIGGAATEVERFRAEHEKLIGQLNTVTGRLAQVSKAYGTDGLAGAEALAVAAGVRISDLLSNDPKKWAVALQMIDGLVRGYNNMGVGATQLGNALNVLTVSQSDQLKAMSNLNTAYDQFTKIVSGPVDGFLQFANTLKRFQSDAGKAGASISGLGTGFSGVSKKVTDASLQLQSDFQDTFSSATQMADAFRLTGTSAAKQIGAIKDWVAVLIPMAGSNKAAAAEVSVLAQEAGGPATTNLKTLGKWAGNIKDPLGKAQKAAQGAAVSFFNMSEDAKKLGTTLQQDLAADTAKAVESAVGLSGAMDKFSKDLTHSGVSISQTNSDRKKLVADLAAVGVKGASANAIIESISGQLQGVKGPVTNAAAQFEDFANNSLGLSTQKADALWKSLHDQNLTILGGKAKITKDQFISLAENGWNLSTQQAEKLWKKLQEQYLDKLGSKTDITKKKFEQLAHDGLDLSTAKADALWKKLQAQRLDEVGTKADTTRGKFEKLAAQIGINTKNADLWFTALRLIPHSVSTKITVDGKGNVVINGATISPGAFFSPHAHGGFISGGVPNKDSVPGMLMPGEVVVPTTMVNQGAVDHLRGRLPGFAAGGQVGSTQAGTPHAYASGGVVRVGDTGNLRSDFGKNLVTTVNDITGRITGQITQNATKALAQWAANALGKSGAGIVSYARSFLGKIPYVFGGTSFSGDDCSGFTQAVYGKFGIHAPRTSEAQYAWANKHAPVPGALAFYVSPGGGPPPGHVAIVQDAKSVISQGGPQGVKGPKIQSLRFLPLMGTGVPPGGLPTPPSGGSGNGGIGGPSSANAAQAKAYAASRLGDFGWASSQMKFLDELWTRESGWNRLARNPSSGAYGIPQALPPSKMGTAANPPTSSAAAQINWGLGYIKDRKGYGSPQAAWSHELSWGWYGKGGQIPGYATGGVTTTGPTGGPAAITALRRKIVTEEHNAGRDYLGLRAAFLHGPAKYRTKLTMQELGTLAARQATEVAAYHKLAGAGLTKTNLAKMASAARAEARTAADQWLNRTPGGHPGWAKGLRYWLGQLSATGGKGLPGGQLTSGPGGKGLPAITHTYGGDVANNIGAFISAVAPFMNGGMVQSYDQGGWLKPGLTMAYNGTGRNEAVSATGGGTITFEVTPSGNAFDAFLISWLKKNVKVKGGGNVQKAWGSH